jgi:ribose transport system substrate-binding protein
VNGKMKQRFVLLLLIVSISYGLSNAQIKSNQRTITIGMIGKMGNNPVFIAAYSGARVAAKELGTKYKVEIVIDWQTPGDEDVQKQAAAIERFSNSGVNGIAISCTDANYLTPIIDEAVDKGTPVMCFDSDAPKSKRFAYYGADDIEFGKMLMKELATELKGKGTIAVLAGNKNALNQQRRLQGVKEELKNYPKIILSPDNIHHNIEIPEPTVDLIKRVQKVNPNISGWIFQGSWALLVKNSFTWDPGEVKIVAGNAVPAELDYVKNGYVQSLVGVNCFQYGYKSVELLLNKIINQQTPEDPLMYTQLIPVTKKNVDEWSLNWKKWLIKEAVSR